jgi:hypothetical protein
MKKYITIFVLILLTAFAFYAYFAAGNNMRSYRGLHTGKNYIEKMYNDYSVAGQNCQGEDTNADNYITCNFRLKENATLIEKTITLQCPTFIKSYLGTSCKEVGITLNQN